MSVRVSDSLYFSKNCSDTRMAFELFPEIASISTSVYQKYSRFEVIFEIIISNLEYYLKYCLCVPEIFEVIFEIIYISRILIDTVGDVHFCININRNRNSTAISATKLLF